MVFSVMILWSVPGLQAIALVWMNSRRYNRKQCPESWNKHDPRQRTGSLTCRGNCYDPIITHFFIGDDEIW
jgi:hypothetical protein